MFKLLFLPVKALRLGVKLAGVRNSLLILVGVGIGLLVAPATGAETRDRLRARLAERGIGTDPLLAEADYTV